jgi:hypothetical protein
LINGKIYIGKHVTDNPNDNYLGSGDQIKDAVKKYGEHSFKKEVLHIFDNEKEMIAKEKEIVTPDFILLESNYNMSPGGQGGCIVLFPEHPLYQQTVQKFKDVRRTKEYKNKQSEIVKQLHKKQKKK